ncbi:MAG: hypothetical protein Q9185_003544 [Variospora sp. 1 TL-2023]
MVIEVSSWCGKLAAGKINDQKGWNDILAHPTTRLASSSSSSSPSTTTGGDLGNPQSASREQSSVKSSRATQGGAASSSSPDTASLQQPVSERSSIPGEQDEGTPSHDNVKQDPAKPAEEKRRSVERQGERPLGAEG